MARIQKNLLLTPNDIAKFQKLAEKAQQITIDNLKKDEDYEDAPDEFIGKFLKKIIAFSYSRISVNKKSYIYNQSIESKLSKSEFESSDALYFCYSFYGDLLILSY